MHGRAIFQSQFIKAKRVVRAPQARVSDGEMLPAQFIRGIDIQASLIGLYCEVQISQRRVVLTTPCVGRGSCPVGLQLDAFSTLAGFLAQQGQNDRYREVR